VAEAAGAGAAGAGSPGEVGTAAGGPARGALGAGAAAGSWAWGFGSSVPRSTTVGAATILGCPGWACAGGVGVFVTRTVLAPGLACTTVGVTDFSGATVVTGAETLLLDDESPCCGRTAPAWGWVIPALVALGTVVAL
jgi:hypothetical protein